MLVRADMRSISAGIVALAIGFALKGAWTTSAPADAGPTAEKAGISVFNRLPPEIFDRHPGTVSRIGGSANVRVASLEPAIAFGAAARESGASTRLERPPQPDSFADRFGSSFAERFASLTRATPAPAEPIVPFTGALPKPAAPAMQAAVPPSVVRLPPPNPARAQAQGQALAAAQPAAAPTPAALLASAPALPKRGVQLASAQEDLSGIPDPVESHTAIYDISAHTVYMPNGDRLEAHSGYGEHMDDVHAFAVKDRGPTPPNVYDLTLRKQIFHGVVAIRLNPVGDGKMYGRDGMLAHPYMLGPNGQSNGCVSFNDYPKFLHAFQNGDVTRLVVVEHLANPPPAKGSPDWIPDALKNLFRPAQTAEQPRARDGVMAFN